jgi:hypothetical protein
MIDSTSDDFEDPNGTDERLILGVGEVDDDKTDDDSSNNGQENDDENDRTCRQ